MNDRKRKKHRQTADSPRAGSTGSTSVPSGSSWVNKHRWWLRLGLALVIPAVVLALLEAGWRLSGKHYDWHLFAPAQNERFLGSNVEFGYRFFPRAVARKPVLGCFSAEKSPQTYRIFVLGASAAVGVPDAAFGFWQMLDVMLEQQYPGIDFETINAGVTAINSHVVLPIARECADYEPDLFVVYLGNNELVGPFSTGSSTDRRQGSLEQIRTVIELRKTGVGQLTQAVGARLAGHDELTERWGGMESYAGNFLRRSDPAVQTALDNFAANLTDIVAACTASDARVLLSTVPVNLRDSAPFASLHREDLTDEELAAWQAHYDSALAAITAGDCAAAAGAFERAAAIDDTYAELRFRWARCLLEAGDLAGATRHFSAACDHDALRFRAETRINAAIRRIARESAGQVGGQSGGSGSVVHLADTEVALSGWCRQQQTLPGDNLFYEHVHLNFLGNYLTARALFQEVVSLLPPEIAGRRRSGPLPEPEDCARALALTGFNEYNMLAQIYDMVRKPPFTRQFNHAETVAKMEQGLELLKVDATPNEARTAVEVYQQALRARPNDLLLRFNYAKLIVELGNPEAARIEMDRIERCLPKEVFTE